MIYTSGSTGRPKGVVVAHRGAGQPASAGRATTFALGRDDGVLQSRPRSASTPRSSSCSWRSADGRPAGAGRRDERSARPALLGRLLARTRSRPPFARRLGCSRRCRLERPAARCATLLVRRRGAAPRPGRRGCARRGPQRSSTSTAPPRTTVCVDLRHASSGTAGRGSPIGRPIAEHARLRARPRACEPVPVGRARRAVHRRRRPGARLPRPARADRRALRARPVRRRAGRAPLPHRRPRRAGCPTARSSSSAASTTRSRSAASASSWARSRPRCAAAPGACARPSSSCAGRPRASRAWSPTSSQPEDAETTATERRRPSTSSSGARSTTTYSQAGRPWRPELRHRRLEQQLHGRADPCRRDARMGRRDGGPDRARSARAGPGDRLRHAACCSAALAPHCERTGAPTSRRRSVDTARARGRGRAGLCQVRAARSGRRTTSAASKARRSTSSSQLGRPVLPGASTTCCACSRRRGRPLAPGGAIFVGDVRSLPLLKAFHASVELEHAAPRHDGCRPARADRRRVAQEYELVLDPRSSALVARRTAPRARCA